MNLEGNELIELELRLLSREARTCKQTLNSLIADEFREIGTSGAYFGKKEVLQRLPVEDNVKIEATHFECHSLSDSVTQLTYKCRVLNQDRVCAQLSYRTSIWKRSDRGWQMVFHQGTALKEVDSDL